MSMIVRSMALAAISAFAPAASAQQVEQISNVSATRVNTKDGSFACALAFRIAHPGEAGARGRVIVASFTTYLADDGQPGALLKISYSDTPRVFVPPTEAFLIDADESRPEQVMLPPNISEGGEYGLFNFRYGQKGLRVIGRLAHGGVGRIKAQAPDGGEEIWGIDLSGADEARLSWLGCVTDQHFPLLD